jgi:hypothetical protein
MLAFNLANISPTHGHHLSNTWRNTSPGGLPPFRTLYTHGGKEGRGLAVAMLQYLARRGPDGV